MHSPLDNAELETFFHRLNAPLRRMPPPERAELHVEVRQHLDGLAAAYEELGLSREEALAEAMRAFGEPRRIGKRLYREWRRGQWRGLSGEMKAVLSMLGLCAASTAVLLTALVWSYTLPLFHGEGVSDRSLLLTLLLGVPALAGGVLGRVRPKHALAGAFYATIALTLVPWLIALASAPWSRDLAPLGQISLWSGCWLACGCAAARLTSRGRSKRGRFHLSVPRLRRSS